MKSAWIGLTLLALATAATGCESKPTDGAPPAGTGAPAAADKKEEAKPTENMEEKSLALMEKMSEIFSSNASDCDKMGTELNAFIKENSENFRKLKDYGEKQTPEQKKAFTEKNKGKMEATMKKMEPGLKACMTNQKVVEAMKSMPL